MPGMLSSVVLLTANVCVWGDRMGEAACCEEIKAFIAKHSIKQQQIASLAGKCLPCLSQILFIFTLIPSI